MSKLTRLQTQKLWQALDCMKKTAAFIRDEKTTIIRDKSEINKEIGSDLVYLYNGIQWIESLLNTKPNQL
jgi:hypothetical protein